MRRGERSSFSCRRAAGNKPASIHFSRPCGPVKAAHRTDSSTDRTGRLKTSPMRSGRRCTDLPTPRIGRPCHKSHAPFHPPTGSFTPPISSGNKSGDDRKRAIRLAIALAIPALAEPNRITFPDVGAMARPVMIRVNTPILAVGFHPWHTARSTPSLPAVVQHLRQAKFPWHVTPPQSIATNEIHAAKDATIIGARTAHPQENTSPGCFPEDVLRKERRVPRHPRIRQPEKTAHHHHRNVERSNHAVTAA